MHAAVAQRHDGVAHLGMVQSDQANGLRLFAQLVELLCELVGIEPLDQMQAGLHIGAGGGFFEQVPAQRGHEAVGAGGQDEIDPDVLTGGLGARDEVAQAIGNRQHAVAGLAAHAVAVVQYPVHGGGGNAGFSGNEGNGGAHAGSGSQDTIRTMAARPS